MTYTFTVTLDRDDARDPGELAGAIFHALVDAMGGSITVAPVGGEPAAAPAAPVPPARTKAKPKPAAAKRTRRR
jgi:hypothetical protein